LSKKRKSFKQDVPIQSKSGIKMEKTDKPLTRDALVSMQVIDAKGRLVGKVKDIAFAVGKTGIALQVENDAGEIQHIAWEDVQAASDFILLKAVPQSTSQEKQQPVQTGSLSEEEKVSKPQQPQTVQTRALSEEEKVFGPYEQQPQAVQADVQQQSTQPLCPTCNQPLTWIPQYKRWYCYTDKKYVKVNEKQSTQTPLCPTCNQPLTWIPQYKRWYCYTDKKYV
jgi:sporulation protein YlmC with PRC-barrel domain/ribosomal protein L34E